MRLSDFVCIRETLESPIENEEAYDLLLETDVSYFGLMSTIEKYYSVPYELKVCQDE